MSPVDELKISVAQAGTDGEVTVLRLDGVIDTLTAPDLDQVLSQLLQQSRYKVVCDLAGINYVSSAGWGIFISHLKEIRDHQGDLKLTRLQPDVYEIFELLEFDTIIKSYPGLDQAAGDFARDTAPFQEKISSPAVETLTLPEPKTLAEPEPVKNRAVTIKKPAVEPPTLEDKVLALVAEDPLLRIREIRTQLKTPRFGEEQISSRRVFLILRKNRLLRLRSRCLYSHRVKKSF
jgi:anti-sigma B factor antagonist